MHSIFKRQQEFQANFFDIENMSMADKTKWTKEFVLCLHQELAELMNSLDWKTYHHYSTEYTAEHTQEEIIDCFKFLLNLMIIWGITADTLPDMFHAKSQQVEDRFKHYHDNA